MVSCQNIFGKSENEILIYLVTLRMNVQIKYQPTSCLSTTKRNSPILPRVWLTAMNHVIKPADDHLVSESDYRNNYFEHRNYSNSEP